MLRSFVASVVVIVSIAAAASCAEVREGVVFATRDGQDLMLDIGTPGPGEMRPAIVCIHGGGWGGARQVHREILQALVRRGFVAVTIDYRWAGVAPWPAPLDDVQAALRWLANHADEFGVDPERIAVMGNSAGGHLALMAGMLPRESEEAFRVRAVVNLHGPTDLRDVETIAHVRGTVEALIGGRLEEKSDALKQLSPVRYVDRGDPPVLTFHGTKDRLVPFSQAEILHKHLDDAQVPNRLVPMVGAGHGLGRHAEESMKLIAEFAEQNLRGSEMPLVAFEDFDASVQRWQPTDANAWTAKSKDGRSWYAPTKKKSNYEPKVRSPHNISLLKDEVVADFVLDVDMRSTNEPYGHQSLCLFFGYQDPSHFYYVHFGREADDHANSIFLVNDAPRVSIATRRTDGTDWSRGWHRARIRRNVETGDVQVFMDDMAKPVMVASDKTFTSGRIGVGSFDDTGEFDAIRLRGRKVTQRTH